MLCSRLDDEERQCRVGFEAIWERDLPVSRARALLELRLASVDAYQRGPTWALLRERYGLLSVPEVRQRSDREGGNPVKTLRGAGFC